MKLGIVVHQAEEGGYWAEVPAIPGVACRTCLNHLVPLNV